MKYLTITIALICVAASTVSAQDRRLFYTRQECAPVAQMVRDTAMQYGETALFTGENTTLGTEGQPFRGGAMFFVNQDTGTWTLLTLYQDGVACVSAAGIDFEPYAD
jgi:hypothetical protein